MKTLQELGLPKGFRLTMKAKADIVDIACEEKFGKRVEAIGDMELQIVNCISEFVYSKKRRDTYHQGILAFGSKKDYGKSWHPLDFMCDIRSIDFPLTLELAKATGLMRKLPKKIRKMFKDHPGSSITFSLGHTGWHRQTELTEDIKWMPEKFAKDFWAPKPEGSTARVTNKELTDQLPVEYLRRMYELIFEMNKLNADHLDLGLALRQVLQGFTSTIELCNMHPEFIQWIIKSAGEEEVTRCSDIPVADAMQDVRKILGK